MYPCHIPPSMGFAYPTHHVDDSTKIKSYPNLSAGQAKCKTHVSTGPPLCNLKTRTKLLKL